MTSSYLEFIFDVKRSSGKLSSAEFHFFSKFLFIPNWTHSLVNLKQVDCIYVVFQRIV